MSKDVLIKHKDIDNEWIEIHPVTKTTNVLDTNGKNIEEKIIDHEESEAPHRYGGRFEWRYNPDTDSLDLVML